MAVKLNLNLDKVHSTKPVIVFHAIHYKGQRFRITTGQSIEPKYWDKKEQRVKRTRINYDEYNRLFRDQQSTIERIVLKLERIGREVSKLTITGQLTWLNKTDSETASIISVYNQFIKLHGIGKAERTVKGYNSTKQHLEAYQKQLNRPLSFSDFNQEFYQQFRSFTGLNDNAFGFHIKNIKTFLSWSNEKGFHDTWHFKKWKIISEDGKDQFYLKYDEIKKLAALTLPERLDKVRDLFLIGCYTGLRYSDIVTLTEVHYQQDAISKTTIKTKTKVLIPVIPELKIILDKYWANKKDLPHISNQKGNNYLKEIGKLANLTRQFNYEQIKGTQIVSKTFESWQMLTWHVARHSFITNCVQLGVSPKVVQKLVGHKTFKMMERYVQNDEEFNKTELMKYSNR